MNDVLSPISTFCNHNSDGWPDWRQPEVPLLSGWKVLVYSRRSWTSICPDSFPFPSPQGLILIFIFQASHCYNNLHVQLLLDFSRIQPIHPQHDAKCLPHDHLIAACWTVNVNVDCTTLCRVDTCEVLQCYKPPYDKNAIQQQGPPATV